MTKRQQAAVQQLDFVAELGEEPKPLSREWLNRSLARHIGTDVSEPLRLHAYVRMHVDPVPPVSTAPAHFRNACLERTNDQ